MIDKEGGKGGRRLNKVTSSAAGCSDKNLFSLHILSIEALQH